MSRMNKLFFLALTTSMALVSCSGSNGADYYFLEALKRKRDLEK